MRAFLAEQAQAAHFPESFLVNGIWQPNPERPERIAMLRKGAQDAGCSIEIPPEFGLDPIKAVHPARYLSFLEKAYQRWSYIEGAAHSVTPNIHPSRRDGGYPASVVAQAGWHMSDAGCPIGPDTWNSSLWSAWSAIAAADAALEDGVAYALCRPPGHHASAEVAGGFCYLNNTAIAARRMQSRHPRVAVLDIDLHHGNGTQEIFYGDPSVLTVSIHADPVRFYPFFWGYEAEEGEGAGSGFNLNLPLARGSGDEQFLAALDSAIERIAGFDPGALVIALGLDAFEGDPFGGLAVSTGGYGRIARAISGRFRIPTALVQEGGYLCDELGDNLASFVAGFELGRV